MTDGENWWKHVEDNGAPEANNVNVPSKEGRVANDVDNPSDHFDERNEEEGHEVKEHGESQIGVGVIFGEESLPEEADGQNLDFRNGFKSSIARGIFHKYEP